MDVPTLEAYFNDLIALGTRPAFYHMDINYTYLMKDDGGLTSYAKLTQFNNDMKTLSQFFAKNGIGFGTIIEAGRADNDRTYAQTVLQDVGIINTALGGPPPQVSFESYAGSGPRVIPFNVPDSQPNTLTWLIGQGLQDFSSATQSDVLTPVAHMPNTYTATYIAASVPAGTHTITATFDYEEDHKPFPFTDPDPLFLSSSSTSSALPLGQVQTTTTITSYPDQSIAGETVTYTASVAADATSGLGTPTGSVDFQEGSTDLTPSGVPLSFGVATFSASYTSPANHTITAAYGGSGNFAPSPTVATTQMVSSYVSQPGLSASPMSTTSGQTVTLTANVTITQVLPPGTPPQPSIRPARSISWTRTCPMGIRQLRL